MIDLAALTTVLDTDPRYDTKVRSGHGSGLLALLNAPEPGQTTFRSDVSVDEIKEAIGDGIRTLTAVKLQQLRFLVVDQGTGIDFTKAAIRTELREIFTGNTAVLGRLRDAVSRQKTFADSFGDEPITKEHLRQVLPQISKSYLAQYLARP